MDKIATFISMTVGLGGNNYIFKSGDDEYMACVGLWRKSGFETVIFKNYKDDKRMASIETYTDPRVVMPEEALKRIGIEAIGRPIEKWEVFGSPLMSDKWDVQ